jgi:hypothetical protein
MPQSLESMALDEATRAIDAQHSYLDALKTRSTAVVSAGGVVFSLFTAPTLGRRHTDVFTYFALVAFMALAVAALSNLFPRGFIFRNQVTDLVREIDKLKDEGKNQDIAAVQRDWAIWTTDNYDTNQKKLDGMTAIYTFALAALALQVVLLALQVIFD